LNKRINETIANKNRLEVDENTGSWVDMVFGGACGTDTGNGIIVSEDFVCDSWNVMTSVTK